MAESKSSGSEDSDGSSGDDSSRPPTDLMITTRERRKTAGNRYSQVVAQEQADDDAEDDVALLFAEAEGEDEEYNSDEADDEADMSSSDDDDQGPDAGGEDLEGEQELQNQAKIERQKKRKADMALTTMNAIKKKPKIDPTSLHRAVEKAKPSKRKERISWLPDSDAAPGRTSLRKQTVAHREIMMERLKENEEVRLRNKAQREKKEKLKQAEAPKEMTQADRLAEAARNERRNAKSLNRWEAKEKERAEEQAARLAALKERKLDGAVLTLHSARHAYQGPRTERVSPGPGGIDDPPMRRKYQRKPKILPEAPASVILPPTTVVATSTPSESLPTVMEPLPPAVAEKSMATEPPKPSETQKRDSGWLAGIQDYALLPSADDTQDSQVAQAPSSGNDLQTAKEAPTELSHEVSNQNEENREALEKQGDDSESPPKPQVSQSEHTADNTPFPILPQVPVEDGNSGSNTVDSNVGMGQNTPSGIDAAPGSPSASNRQSEPPHQANGPSAAGIAPQNQPPVVEVISTRNLVVLDKFDELSSGERREYSVFYNTKKSGRPNKMSTEYCAITGQIAKYRDPSTGVSYASLKAYRKLKDTQSHKFSWSSMLGCYVGRLDHVARGVPDGFLTST